MECRGRHEPNSRALFRYTEDGYQLTDLENMKYVLRLFTFLLFLAGCIGLLKLSTENGRLSIDVNRLEAELGRMSIDNVDRVHLVEVETPDVPPEVASQVERVWQFRCYLPAGYDFMQLSGSGRVTKDGLYQNGGYSSSYGTPKLEATHQLLTVSLQKKSDRLQVHLSLGGSSGTTSWSGLSTDRFDALVVQQLVSSDQGPRSFNQDTILPLLKIFDPSTAEDKEVAGNTLTTYAGGLIVLCPKSRENILNQLLRGETPNEFEPGWLATEVGDE
jgi:hypothetical protein